jgi:metallophosphoesterase (TIGR03767 family)
VLRAAAAGAGAAALPPAFFPSRAAAAGRPVRVEGTTLERTIVRAATDLRAGGYRLLVTGPAEPHVVRDDLGAAPQAGRTARRKPVSVFVQFTDVHAVDAQSPARVEFLDRYSDEPGQQVPFEAAWRPQEAVNLQVSDRIVAAVRQVARGPVTGKAFEFAVSTGDNVDNVQLNETRWFVTLLDGGTVVPDSGDLTKWEGVQDADAGTYDVHYWHPDGTPSGKADDNARAVYGFPTVPGFLDAARKPFVAGGIGTPWYAVFGNHDPLLQGNAPAFVNGTDVPTGFATVATGSVKVVGLPAGLSPNDVQRGLAEQDPAVLTALATAPSRQVTADPKRRPLTKSEFMAQMFETTGTPVGHGFGQANVAAAQGWYAFDHGTYLRCIVLDTVNYGGYSEGSISQEQHAWLVAELEANAATQRLAIVFSHHPASSMSNPIVSAEDTGPRVLGDAVVATLLKYRNVVLWVNGHTHRNDVIAHPGPNGGFWEVNTAAHIDFPHQSRILEIVDNLDGTLSVFATVVDADAPLGVSAAASYAAPTTVEGLAALGRELGANDWQNRESNRRGEVQARNVELVVAAPFDLGLGGGKPQHRDTGSRPRTGPRIPDTGLADRAPSIAGALAVAAAGLAAARRRAAVAATPAAPAPAHAREDAE